MLRRLKNKGSGYKQTSLDIRRGRISHQVPSSRKTAILGMSTTHAILTLTCFAGVNDKLSEHIIFSLAGKEEELGLVDYVNSDGTGEISFLADYSLLIS